MRVRLSTLRRIIAEAFSTTHTTSQFTPGDKDATVPGHLPEELPASIGDIDADESVDEEAAVPGTWLADDGEPVSHDDANRLHTPAGLGEVDKRTEGDADDDGLSAHLRADVSLGEPGEHDL